MSEKEPRVKTDPSHFRIPIDVKASAQARADGEHRTLTDTVVRFLRAYGDGDPSALAIAAGVSPAILEIHARTVQPARASRARNAGPTAAALSQERAGDARDDAPPASTGPECKHTYPDVRNVAGQRVCRKCPA